MNLHQKVVLGNYFFLQQCQPIETCQKFTFAFVVYASNIFKSIFPWNILLKHDEYRARDSASSSNFVLHLFFVCFNTKKFNTYNKMQ